VRREQLSEKNPLQIFYVNNSFEPVCMTSSSKSVGRFLGSLCSVVVWSQGFVRAPVSQSRGTHTQGSPKNLVGRFGGRLIARAWHVHGPCYRTSLQIFGIKKRKSPGFVQEQPELEIGREK
jgi:hypothetical protein